MPKAIIIGASSGIGRELAKILEREGYELGLVARRDELLLSLKEELNSKSTIKALDISSPDAIGQVESLISEMGGCDLVVISSGVGFINPNLDWGMERETIEVNVLGFAAMANLFIQHFLSKNSGHLVGISSIAALRGSSCYSASKAFVTNYLEGLRHKMAKEKRAIVVTDIMPGYVDTRMAKGRKLFWVTPVDKAAAMIYRAIRKRKTHAYISRRWRLIAWIFKWMPQSLYDRFL
jgi:short-subunit dehydrogenase